MGFLNDVAANNNRPWFLEHKEEYNAAREDFERGIESAILRISAFDPSVSHITVKDATYRFYRDTRFSNDKSPYKNHFGAYIAAHGKKALHGGYYIHLEPGPDGGLVMLDDTTVLDLALKILGEEVQDEKQEEA